MKKLVKLLSVFFLFASVMLFTACPPTVDSQPNVPDAGDGTDSGTSIAVTKAFLLEQGSDSIVVTVENGAFSQDVSLADFSLDDTHASYFDKAQFLRRSDNVVIIGLNSEVANMATPILAIKGKAFNKGNTGSVSVNIFSGKDAMPADYSFNLNANDGNIALVIRLYGLGQFTSDVNINDFDFVGINAEDIKNGTFARVSDTEIRISGFDLVEGDTDETVTIKSSAFLIGTTHVGMILSSPVRDISQTVAIESSTASLDIYFDFGSFNESLSASDFNISNIELQDGDIFRVNEEYVSINLPRPHITGDTNITLKASAFSLMPQDITIDALALTNARITGGNNTFLITIQEGVLPLDIDRDTNFSFNFNDYENARIFNSYYNQENIGIVRKNDTQVVVTVAQPIPNDDIAYFGIEGIAMSGSTLVASYDSTINPPSTITNQWGMSGISSSYNDAYILLFGGAFKSPVNKSFFSFSGDNSEILQMGSFSVIERANLPSDLLVGIEAMENFNGMSILENAIKIDTSDFEIHDENDFVSINTQALSGIGDLFLVPIPSLDARANISGTIQGLSENSIKTNSITIDLMDGTFVDSSELDVTDFVFSSKYDNFSITRQSDTSVMLTFNTPVSIYNGETVTVKYSALATKSTAMTAKVVIVPSDVTVSYTAFADDIGLSIELDSEGTFASVVDINDFEFFGTNASVLENGTVERISDTLVRITYVTLEDTQSYYGDGVVIKASAFASAASSATVTAIPPTLDKIITVSDVEAASTVLSFYLEHNSIGAFKTNVNAGDVEIPGVMLQDDDIIVDHKSNSDSHLYINLPKNHGLNGEVSITIKESAFDTIDRGDSVNGYAQKECIYSSIGAGVNTFNIRLDTGSKLAENLILGYSVYISLYEDAGNEDAYIKNMLEGGINLTRVSDTELTLTFVEKLPNAAVISIFVELTQGTMHDLAFAASFDANVQPPEEITSMLTDGPMLTATEYSGAYLLSFNGAFNENLTNSDVTFVGKNKETLQGGTFSYIENSMLPQEILTFAQGMEEAEITLGNAIKIETGLLNAIVDPENNYPYFDDIVHIKRTAFEDVGAVFLVITPSPDAITELYSTASVSKGDNVITVTLNSGAFADVITESDYYCDNHSIIKRVSDTEVQIAFIYEVHESEEVDIRLHPSAFKTKATLGTITASDKSIKKTFNFDTYVDTLEVTLDCGSFIEREDSGVEGYVNLKVNDSYSSGKIINDTTVGIKWYSPMKGAVTITIPPASFSCVTTDFAVTAETVPSTTINVANPYSNFTVVLDDGSFISESDWHYMNVAVHSENKTTFISATRISDNEIRLVDTYNEYSGELDFVIPSEFFAVKATGFSVQPTILDVRTNRIKGVVGSSSSREIPKITIELVGGSFVEEEDLDSADFSLDYYYYGDYAITRDSDTMITLTFDNPANVSEYDTVIVKATAQATAASSIVVTAITN